MISLDKIDFFFTCEKCCPLWLENIFVVPTVVVVATAAGSLVVPVFGSLDVPKVVSVVVLLVGS